MKNNHIVYLLISAGLLFLLSLSSKNAEDPAAEVQRRILNDLQTIKERLEQFKQSVSSDTELNQSEYYLNLRESYKLVESYVVFRYPDIDKAINGGPVPSIETEVVILHKDDPHGMQVIEELLQEDLLPKRRLIEECDLLNTKFQILESAFKKIPIHSWEILEASHMAISRLMSLSLSGFDSPEFGNGIRDSRVVLKSLQVDLTYFNRYNPASQEEVEKYIKSSLANLQAVSGIEELNHYNLYRSHLIPLQNAIYNMHSQSGFERYDEASTVPRSIGRGPNLFSTNYLDPLFSMRGAVNKNSELQTQLGKILFYDPILSSNGKRACSSCHDPNKAFTDGLKTSKGFDDGHFLMRNSPGLINSAYQTNFFWDLKSEDMNDQIMHVIKEPQEFKTSMQSILAELNQSEEYQKLFKEAFSSFDRPINSATVKTSLELYVRSLVSLNSKFDKNIRSEEATLTKEEILGANLFFGKAACATCHFPPIFNGLVPPHYQDTEGEILGIESKPKSGKLDGDMGVYNRFMLIYPGASFVEGMFKTSTVRNIEYTAPYMHNGQYRTLEEVVEFYNEGGGAGRGINIPQQTLAADSLGLEKFEIAAIVAFMKTLSDTSQVSTGPFPLPKFGDARDERTWGGDY